MQKLHEKQKGHSPDKPGNPAFMSGKGNMGPAQNLKSRMVSVTPQAASSGAGTGVLIEASRLNRQPLPKQNSIGMQNPPQQMSLLSH